VSGAWSGWIWVATAKRWRKVCEGESLSQCHRRLTREMRRWGVLDKHCAMTTGGVPTFTPQGA
jgi:hypothetical protein